MVFFLFLFQKVVYSIENVVKLTFDFIQIEFR